MCSRNFQEGLYSTTNFTLFVLILYHISVLNINQVSCLQRDQYLRARQTIGEIAGDDERHSEHHPHARASNHRRLRDRAVYMAYDHSRVNSSESLSSGWFYQQDQHAILDQCCACDEAKYELVFEGLWSKYTHPDDFPENYWLAYFSDIIGASHSNDFKMWAQDSLASDGVKELAETGVTKKLESELKQVSSKTRTIIKAREMRYPTLNSKTSAVFRTDKHHHLVSILSKLGPSPDWMVGVSSLELCQLDCTWAAQRVVNLYLWDAGTDSGASFTASDMPTRPQERIHPYRRSPGGANGNLQFGSSLSYDRNQKQDQSMVDPSMMLPPVVDESSAPYQAVSVGTMSNQQLAAATATSTSMQQSDQMKPFARLTVTRQRIYEKSCNANTGEPMGTSNQQNQQQQPLHLNHLHPTITSDTLIEPSPRPTYSDCRFTDWSDWSSCSSTCGKGIRTRTRSFYDDQAHLAGCLQSDLIEKEVCLAECIGNTSCVTHDWSEWSKCSVNCGQGYKKRTRSLIGPMRATCESIELAEMEQCTGNCGQDGEQTVPSHCAVTEWSQWSECSVACGRGTKIRTRQFVRREDMENCGNVKLLQKQSCTGRPELCKDVSKRLQDRERICMLSSDRGMCKGFIKRWHYDMVSGKCKRFIYGGCAGNENNFHTIQECRRTCISTPQKTQNLTSSHRWAPECQLKKSGYLQQPKSAQQPKSHSFTHQFNSDLPVIDCKLSTWSPWSTCSALCGYGKRTRSRHIIQMPQNGGKPCDKKLSRTQRCKDLPPCPVDYSTNQAGGGVGGLGSSHRNNKHFAHQQVSTTAGPSLNQFRTTTSTTTQGSSMMDDEDDSKFSRLLKAELGHLQLTSWTPTESYISDSATTSGEMEVIGSSSFQIRNGFVYPFGDSRRERSSLDQVVR